MAPSRLEIILALNAQAFKKGVNDTGRQLKQMSGGVKTAFDRTRAAVSGNMNALQAPVRALTGTVARLGAAFGAVFATRRYLQVAEEYAGIDARLKLVTGSAEELRQVQEDLYDLSQRTGTSYTSNAATYTKLATALKSAGASSKELLGINEAVSKSLVVNGSSAAETSSFLLQFGQAMGSGVLQGDEFRAMMESNSYFAQQLAAALGTDVAGLRAMSKQGELTTDKIREVVPKMLQQIDEDFAKMPLTIGRAMTMLSNAFGKIVRGSDEAGGATGKIAQAIRNFVAYLENNGKKIENFIVGLVETITNLAKTAWKWKEFIATLAGTVLAVSAIANLTVVIGGLNTAIATLTGLSLVGWFSRLGVAAWGALAALGPHGILLLAIAAAAVYAVYSIGKLISNYKEIKRLQKDTAEIEKTVIKNKGEIAQKLKLVSDATGVVVTSMDELNQAIKDGKIHYDDLSGEWKKGAGEMSDASRDVAKNAEKSARDQAKAQKGATDEMKKAYKDYADEVKRLQDDIAGRERSLAEQLREMDRGAMSAPAAWRDRRAQAEEFAVSARKAEAAAKAAFEAGDESTGRKKYEEALTYYDKARDAAEDLNTEVSYGGKVILNQAQALEKARPLVEKYGKAGIDTQKKFEEAIKKAADALDEQSDGALSKEMPDAAKALAEVTTKTEGYKKKVEETKKTWETLWETVGADGKKTLTTIAGEIRKLDGSTITIYTKHVERRILGGLIGSAQRMAAGGAVAFRNMLSGGAFPGFGGGDRRHVIAEDGEYMFDKYRSRDLGLDALRILHAGRYRDFIALLMDRFNIDPAEISRKIGQRMSLGGIVGRMSLPAMPSAQMLADGGAVVGGGSGGGRYEMDFSGLPGQQRQIRGTFDNQSFEELVRIAERRRRLGGK